MVFENMRNTRYRIKQSLYVKSIFDAYAENTNSRQDPGQAKYSPGGGGIIGRYVKIRGDQRHHQEQEDADHDPACARKPKLVFESQKKQQKAGHDI